MDVYAIVRIINGEPKAYNQSRDIWVDLTSGDATSYKSREATKKVMDKIASRFKKSELMFIVGGNEILVN